jgi:predicted AAA+ superfamily ATPase
LSELGGALGIDYHSVAHLIDIFEGTFLVRRLQPYHANIGKRLVKSPKVYVRDSGMLHALLDIPFTRKALLANPKAGASFETFCIEQLISHAQLVDPNTQAFFYRTHDGHEIDLLLRLRGRLYPIEIKLGVTPPSPVRIERCMEQLSLPKGYVVAPTKERLSLSRKVEFLGLDRLIAELRLEPKE